MDENNGAVPAANLSFRSKNSPVVSVQVTTGVAGDFRVDLPGTGSFAVTVTHSGFFPLKETPLEVGAETPRLRFVLNHLTEMVSTIDVRSDLDTIDLQQTESQKSLSDIDIANVPYRGRNIGPALKLLPGVLEDPAGGVHLSGSAVNQVLYTLDGFNVTDPLTGDLSARLNIDTVRTIQYSSGRYSSEFGKGSAGTVAITTHMGTDALRYNATNFVPGVDTANGLHIGTWSPRFEFTGPIVKKKIWFSNSSDGVYSQLIVPDVKGKNRTSTIKLDNLFRTQINLTPTDQLTASVLYNWSDAPGTGLGALDPYSTTTDRRSATWFASVKHSRYFRDGGVLEWGFAEDRTLARQVPQGAGVYVISPFGRSGNFFANTTELSTRKQLMANYSPHARHWRGTHQLKAGIDLDRLNYSAAIQRTSYEIFGLGGYMLSRISFTGTGHFERPNFEASAYLADSWKLRPSLTIEAGIRQDWDELVHNVALSPRLAVAWAPFHWKNTKISGGYAVTRDASQLPLFSRPLDQQSVTVNYGPDGQPAFGPAITHFQIGSHLRAPRYRNWTVDFEHRFPRHIALTAKYARKRGDDGLTYVVLPAPYDPAVNAVFELANYRRDVFDSAEVSVRQSFGKQHEWMASYTRSRALSNSVISLSVDEPLWVNNNVGRMPWDTPNRLLAWGHFPTPLKDWSFASLVEARNGFPFSVVTDYGSTVGEVNSHRYPMFFDLDFYLERRMKLGKRLVALRGGFSNITNHKNPTVVNAVIGAPTFMTYYGSQGRHVVFRLRWLGTGE